MQVANNKNFNDILASSRLVLVDFWASWCGPCRMLSPIVDDIAKEFEGKIEVAKCNIDDAEEVAAKYGIRSIPTLLFFKDGEVVDKTVGFVNKAEIEKRINNLL
ncbi:MAG TPA: thioredoxin [Candidatus Cryptobacteroides sp.]|jgi:thioredoxin 1|nr:thioredoxin [Candidatus Cryptobacteroides sp.]